MASYNSSNNIDPLEQCEGPKLNVPEALKEQALNAYKSAMEAKGKGCGLNGLTRGTSCPNCGYCPSCGRSNGYPGQVWCSTGTGGAGTIQ